MIGTKENETSAATDEILTIPKTSSQTKHMIRPNPGTRVRITASDVATPLPPLKFSHTGKIWPSTAVMPTNASATGSSQNHPATNIAKAPFPASNNKVHRATNLPAFLKTLVAPILPDPKLLISPWPENFVNKIPKGMDPRKYENTNKNIVNI